MTRRSNALKLGARLQPCHKCCERNAALIGKVRPIPATATSHGEQGASLVETALSIVILLTVIFGVFEICLAVYSYHFISEAAREGTRYAIVRGSTCSGFTSACPASTTDIKTYVKSISFPGIDPTKMTVLPSWSAYTSSGNSCPATGPCNSPGNLVTIQVQYSFPLAIPFIPARTLAMTSTSSMIISQ